MFVSKGDVAVQFAIKALQNTIINSERKVEFTTTHATGGVAASAGAKLWLEIKDDELALQLKKYETVLGIWRASREFTYND